MAFQRPVPVLTRRQWLVLCAALALVLGAPGASAAAGVKAGEARLAHGAVTAQGADGSIRLVGKGSPVFEGDVVTTAPRSVAVLEMIDDTRIIVRPDSKLKVESYSTVENQESAVMRLFKGGLRTVTGFIAKRKPSAVRLNTTVATIGIRGTEFDARLCEEDCAEEAKARPAPAGRVGFARGSLIARAASGRSRELEAGDPVYSGETLVTGARSYAVVAFRDDSRVTLFPDTDFRVEQLQYDEEKPSKSRAVFNLLRGGLRAVTGAIGKVDRRNYRMKTAVATIGIRGTGYDLLCQGTCVNPGGPHDPAGDGLFAEPWDGTIDFDGQYQRSAGEGPVFLANLVEPPVPVPDFPFPMTVPQPQTVPIPETPVPPSSSAPEKGLYVGFYTGEGAVETPQNVVPLGPGDAGYVGAEGGPAEELPEIPAWQAEDPVYKAVEFGDVVNALDQLFGGGVGECLVQ